MNKRAIGKNGEDIAASYIEKHGAAVVYRNFFYKGGEVDLIAFDNWMNEKYLCFIEVKMRSDADLGYPEEAVTPAKQKKIIKGAMSYMNYKKISYEYPVRFDVVSILNDEVKWIKNAFTT